jgi:hypothetical protein
MSVMMMSGGRILCNRHVTEQCITQALASGTNIMSFECYSQRMLNPFRGIVSCIRYKSADAVTADGKHWDIYVSNAGLLKDLTAGHRSVTYAMAHGRNSRA